jgi:hypothetical protein
LVVAALLASACSTAPPVAPPVAAKKPARALDVRDFAPAAGLRWLVLGRPAQIASNADLSRSLSPILPPARLDAYAASTGADLRLIPNAAVAGYALGTLYLAELPASDGARVRETFAGRLRGGGIVKQPRAGIFRVSGTDGDMPRALVSVEDRLIAAVTGDPTLARAVAAYAEARLRSPTALRGAALSSLPAAPADALAVFYAPGPFEGPWATAASGLLASAFAVSVSVEALPDAQLRFIVTLAGDWRDYPLQERGLERSWASLANSSTGRLLALDRARNLKSTRHLQHLTLSMEIPMLELARGVRAATSANIREILEGISQDFESTASPP